MAAFIGRCYASGVTVLLLFLIIYLVITVTKLSFHLLIVTFPRQHVRLPEVRTSFLSVDPEEAAGRRAGW